MNCIGRATEDANYPAALCLRLDLVPTTLLRHENGTFRTRSQNQRNLKTPAFRFRVDGTRFENGVFRKR